MSARRVPIEAGTLPWELLRAIRLVIRADADPARQALLTTLLETHPSVRLAHQLHSLLGRTHIATALVGGFGLASLFSIASPLKTDGRVLAAGRHANARREIARLSAVIGEDECRHVRCGAGRHPSFSNLAVSRHLLRRRGVSRVMRVLGRIDRRHGFLVGCRVAAALAWYARSTLMLRERRPVAVLVSSDSNPEELGFLAAARSLGIPQVFIAHAYPTAVSPPLDFTLSILEGEAAVQARRLKGPVRGTILLAGLEGASSPMDPARLMRAQPVIGIFTSKALSWTTFAALVDDCRRLGARKILVRWHPSMLERPRLSRRLRDRALVDEAPDGASLADVARQCDWVVADQNSNVHLPVLKLGIPTVAVTRLGVYPESRSDQYGFVANGVIAPPVRSLGELNLAALAEFFEGEWSGRFARYDASYLKDAEGIMRSVRAAVLRLLDGASDSGSQEAAASPGHRLN